LPQSEKAALLVAEAKTWLADYRALLETASEWTEVALKASAEAFMAEKSLKPKQFMPAIRAALSGKEASAGSIYQIMCALEKPETLGRIADCC
jgi:glutamyl/glutaminyl-tRNA synthetase